MKNEVILHGPPVWLGVKESNYDNFTLNDDETEIKQLKAVYLQCYKTACCGVRAQVYIQSSSLSILENMLPKVFKNRGCAAGHLRGLFFHFHRAGPSLLTATDLN